MRSAREGQEGEKGKDHHQMRSQTDGCLYDGTECINPREDQ